MIMFESKRRKKIGLKILCFLLFSIFLSNCGKASVSPQPISGTEAISVPKTVSADDTEISLTVLPTKVAETPSSESATAVPMVADYPGLELAIFASDNFVGSGNCAVCHSALLDENGNDVSNDSHWRSAIMANSAKDPFWQAKVSSEFVRNPELKAVIEDKCATCHTPMTHTEASSKGETVMLLENGVLNHDNPKSVSALDGVSCSLCHQIQDLHLGEMDSFSGRYVIDTAAVSPDRFIFGPFQDQFGQLMIGTVGYSPVYGAQTLDSGLCATCHTLYTPYVDALGEIKGEFPEQTAYLEWESSIFGDSVDEDQSCQNCHMPEAEGTVVISNMPRNLTPRSPFAQHYFVGGNAFILNILQDHIPDLALTGSTENFNATVARVLNQLQNDTAEVSILEAEIQEDIAEVLVKIENKAGHKFPTGFPSRRVWIHLILEDSTGQLIFESGKPLPDGSIMGDDADTDLLAYESHYDVISSPDQVQIYQSVMQNTDGQVTYTLLRGAGYVKDNRILPEGFDKELVIGDIAVYGLAAEDENFVGGSDQVQYLIDLEGASGPYTVIVELLYQSVSSSFMQDLGAGRTEIVDRFNNYYLEADKTPVVITTAEKIIE